MSVVSTVLSTVAAVTQTPFLGGASILAFVGLFCHDVLGSCRESCAGAAWPPQQLHPIVCIKEWDCRASTRGPTQVSLMIGSFVLRGCHEGKIIMGLLIFYWCCEKYWISGENGKERKQHSALRC